MPRSSHMLHSKNEKDSAVLVNPASLGIQHNRRDFLLSLVGEVCELSSSLIHQAIKEGIINFGEG